MATPTIAARLRRRFLLMTTDVAVRERLQAQVPTDWEMVAITSLDEAGDWNEILLYRFLLLDLDEVEAFDPIDVIRTLRMEYLLQIAVLCFGGDTDIQDEMRMSRADRFYAREEIVTVLPQFLAQYAW
ncbi:hypothetical protein [Acidiferrobacter thiooxydans]|jgi:hypothetical protein|uniref:Uncharacterized protein n=1 Tax=Acidiferrobacter thiooxydans TaxID=163359 RepID=A0A1C2G0T3_9GAMM|nr:hypothetical protein [Acidiferrobacter thiooxydans]RCN58875.1 hypothetical protein C4900_03700 [Acidiferrobacter thiooxydans]UEO00592.1 hypothetical protein A9R16_004075 [Acidiferrobacter thiooxydans]